MLSKYLKTFFLPEKALLIIEKKAAYIHLPNPCVFTLVVKGVQLEARNKQCVHGAVQPVSHEHRSG